ncbi:MAG: hypothetical protein RML56_15005 [Burkholderiales bacterium]|nr:hypothetical protein [Burkholderiales bacterium]
MTTLVMLSGGLDSTACLYKLLRETDWPIHAHHIRLMDREGRARAEQHAVEAIVGWCRRHLRPFRYSESALDFSQLEAIPVDWMAIAYVACQVAIDTPGCRRIAVGILGADLQETRWRASERQRRLFEAMYEYYRARKLGEPEVEWIYPVYALDKAAVAALLPAELRAFAWSCRRPVTTPDGYRACGECRPCRKRAEVAQATNLAL